MNSNSFDGPINGIDQPISPNSVQREARDVPSLTYRDLLNFANRNMEVDPPTMKKTMWIGCAGSGGSLAVGYDGSKLHVVSDSEGFKKDIFEIFDGDYAVEQRKNNPDFDFPAFIGTSSMYFMGEESEWDKDIFGVAQQILDHRKKQSNAVL